jgi:hypothetical protein
VIPNLKSEHLVINTLVSEHFAAAFADSGAAIALA